MTYDDFKTGLFIKYHFIYLKSILFIKFNIYHNDTSAVFENAIILMVDAENVLAGIKNCNMVEALCLMAQGYLQWEIGELLNLSKRTIENYVFRIKRKLEEESKKVKEELESKIKGQENK